MNGADESTAGGATKCQNGRERSSSPADLNGRPFGIWRYHVTRGRSGKELDPKTDLDA